MATVNDFVGIWKIRFLDGNAPFQENWFLLIGTDTAGDEAPTATPEGQEEVGFAILNAIGEVQNLESEAQGPLRLCLVGEALQWTGSYNGQPMWFFVSVAKVQAPQSEGTSLTHTYLYGVNIWGDPDQVGVWGGGAGTPPTPPTGG